MYDCVQNIIGKHSVHFKYRTLKLKVVDNGFQNKIFNTYKIFYTLFQ